MGYDVGQGKRAAFGIGDFLIGVYSPQKERFLTVAKIGTGLSDEEWKQLRVKIQDSRSGEKPKEYEVTKQMECDFWVICLKIQKSRKARRQIHSKHKKVKMEE
jgi:DNA ligase-1